MTTKTLTIVGETVVETITLSERNRRNGLTSAPLDAIPKNFEVGYEDGVWLIASELYPQEDQVLDFDAGLSFFLMFTTYHLTRSRGYE